MTSTMLLEDRELDRTRAELGRITLERDAACKLVVTLLASAAKMKTTLEHKLAKLQHQLDELRKLHWGPKSEKLEAEEPTTPVEGDPPAKEAAKKTTRKKGHGWRKIPKEAPREEVVLEPEEKDLICDVCGARRTSIGSPEVTERWNARPRAAFVAETVRPRYRCPRCLDGTVIAPLPPAPLGNEGGRGRAEAGFLAQLVVWKFADHLPLHRQSGILKRSGVCIPPSTLGDWGHGTAKLLGPIALAVHDDMLKRRVVGLDETGLRIIFKEKGKKREKRRGRIWVYRGLKGEVYFKISATTAKSDKAGPLSVLGNFVGKVQADAAGVFDDLYKSGKRIEIGCRAHERRGYHKARKSNPKEAAFALAFFKKIYEIEARVRDATPEERLAARQTETKPLVDAFDKWVDELAASDKLVPGTPLAKAIGYSQNHRVALRRFLDDPELSPDNNAVERALRLVAVGRRNWLFAGSEVGADDAAILYTLIGSCRELEIDPWEYVYDVIKRRAAGESPQKLTPRAWWEARKKPV
jgi:transposase